MCCTCCCLDLVRIPVGGAEWIQRAAATAAVGIAFAIYRRRGVRSPPWLRRGLVAGCFAIVVASVTASFASWSEAMARDNARLAFDVAVAVATALCIEIARTPRHEPPVARAVTYAQRDGRRSRAA